MTAKIIIYQDSNFRGVSRDITQDTRQLSTVGFNDRVSSIKVIGSVWVGYEHPDYSGKQYILEEGEYASWKDWQGSNNQLSSLKKLNLDIGETPHITLYEHSNYGGRAVNFTYAIYQLSYYSFNNEASSLKVKSGNWILYQHRKYKGKQFIVTEGFYSTPDLWRGADDQISSLRPVNEPYFPTEVLSMEFDIADGSLNSTPLSLVNLSQSNDTNMDQKASWSTSRSVTTTQTYQWNWKNSTAVRADATFMTGVPFISKGEITLGLTNTFSIGENKGNNNTQSEDWNFNLPVTVKANTLLKVQVNIQHGNIEVPFTAVLKKGNRRWKEVGTYKGTQSYNLRVDYKEVPL